jgi:hypothetical protein
VFTVLLPSSCCISLLNYSSFQPSCHNINNLLSSGCGPCTSCTWKGYTLGTVYQKYTLREVYFIYDMTRVSRVYRVLTQSYWNSLRPFIQFTMETESENVIAPLNVLVAREETTLATKFHRKPTHTGRYLNSNSNYLPHVKRGTIQSLHNRASAICQEWQDLVKEIAAWEVISSSVVIPEVSLTWSLIPRVAVVWVKNRSLWALRVSRMWTAFPRSLDVLEIDTTSGRSSKPDTLLEVYSWKPGWKEIRYRWHSASTVSPVSVAETTLAKQADLYLCGSGNIGTISSRVS